MRSVLKKNYNSHTAAIIASALRVMLLPDHVAGDFHLGALSCDSFMFGLTPRGLGSVQNGLIRATLDGCHCRQIRERLIRGLRVLFLPGEVTARGFGSHNEESELEGELR